MNTQRISYILNQLGEEGFSFHPVSVPIYQTSIFEFGSFEEFRQALAREDDAHLYTRGNNPTVEVLERKIAALEKGERAKLFAAGVGAIAGAVMAFLQSGDHVVCVRDCYSWTKTLLTHYLPRFGVEATFVDGKDPDEWKAAIRPYTKVFYLESPTTFLFELQNIAAVAQLAKTHGIITILDNSWATPYFQNPLELGVDLVLHSCSKYISGHSDVVGGVVVGSAAHIRHIFKTEFLNLGSVPGPFESWLLLRGLRTLTVRMRQHQANTLAVVEFLLQHPAVETVWYPFHPSHPQYALTRRQMRGGSGLFSLALTTRNVDQIAHFTNSLTHFRRAVSWGGYESLVIPCAVIKNCPPDRINVIRLHVGLDEPDLLIDDLAQALQQVKP